MNGRTVELHGDFLHVRFPNTHIPVLLPQVRQLNNRKWNDEKKYWSIRTSIEAINFVVTNNFDMTPQDATKLQYILQKHARRAIHKDQRVQYAKSTSAPVIPDVASKMKLDAWEYQWNPINYALLSECKFILGDDMAAGKSVESLMITQHPDYIHKPVLVITPVPQTFLKELHKFFGAPGMVLHGPLYGLVPDVRYYFVSYERLKHLFKDPTNLVLHDYVKDMLVIVDEAHMLKNRKTIRNKLASKILHTVENKVLMTGTPVVNRPNELYELLRLLDRDFMPWTTFMKQFCGLEYGPYGLKYDGATNLQSLNRYLYENVFVRREKDQIQQFLPEKTRISVDLKETPVQIQADNMFELFAKNAEMKAKDPDFINWLSDVLDQAPKVGIFCYHQSMVQACCDLLHKKNMGWIRIDGTSSKDERQALADKFAEDPTINGAVLSLSTAGTGMNGLQAATVAVMAETFWTPGVILQAENRFHRPGLKDALTLYYPKYSAFEDRLTELLLQKLAIFKRITDINEIPDSLTDESLTNQLAKEFGIPVGRRKEIK